jgi:meiotic recombination protein SPO11
MKDTLENTDSPASRYDQTPQSQVQDYIDNTLAAALAELDSPDGNPAVTLKRRYKNGSFFINPDNGALETSEMETQISYTWPGRDRHEAWRFGMTLDTLDLRLIVAILIDTAVVIRVLEAIAQAIESGLVVSKRYELCFKPIAGPDCVTESVIETSITTTPPALVHREWLTWWSMILLIRLAWIERR